MKKLLLTVTCLLSLSALQAATPKLAGAGLIAVRIVADSVDLTQYVGKYKFEGLPFEFLTITVKDEKLMVNTGTEEGVLTPIKEATDKYDAAGRATLIFTRDADKKVTGITLDAQGMIFQGKKEA